MTANPVPRRPDDPPGWRLAFAVWDCVRRDGWQPVLKLALLVALVSAGMCGLALSLGPWSLVGGVGGTVLTGLLRDRRWVPWHGGRHGMGERPGQPRR